MGAPIVLAPVCIAVVYVILTDANGLGLRLPAWAGLIVTFGPAFAMGFVIVGCLTARLLRRGGRSALPAYWVRTLTLYVGIVVLLVEIAAESKKFDFRFVGQLFLLPCVTFVGGVVGDAVASARDRRHQGATG